MIDIFKWMDRTHLSEMRVINKLSSEMIRRFISPWLAHEVLILPHVVASERQ